MMIDRLIEPRRPGTGTVRAACRRVWPGVGLVLLALVAAVPVRAQDGIVYHPPRWARFHPLDEEPPPSNPLYERQPELLEIGNPLFTDTVKIDFEKRQITFTRRHGITGQPVWQYHYAELEDYLNSRQRFVLFTGWEETLQPGVAGEEEEKKAPSLDFRMPVHYPAWARRVLGDDPPMLSIHGFQEISISYTGGSKQVAEAEAQSRDPGIQFDQKNHFNIRGSVGRMVSIEIEAGSEDEESFGQQMSDQLKNFKIEYKGEGDELEDEIIQEVVAGYTNFQMPGAGLAGYSESHEGLFGIKVRSQFGPLTLTTIASHEQSKSEKKELDLSSGGSSGDWTIKSEKDFARYRFYWLDTTFLHKDLGLVAEAPVIEELQVYRLEEYDREEQTGEVFIRAKYGDQTDPTTSFKLLRPNEEYYRDLKRGYIAFYDAANVQENTIIGIYMRMRMADGTLDTLGDTSRVEAGEDLRTNLYVLKPRGAIEPGDRADSTFNLMWRNVYRLPDNAKMEDFEMTVQAATDSSERPDKSDRKFSTILGIADDNGDILRQQSDIFVFPDQQMYGAPPNYEGYLIIPSFAHDTMFHRDWPFANPELGTSQEQTNYGTKIYTTTGADLYEIDRAFLIRMKGSSSGQQRSVHNLGFGVIENSEKLIMTPGNVRLSRNYDYTIDYMTGRLELISQRALSATKIDVDYQQESMFMFDKRGFLGVHGKLDLPFIGRNSYLGTTLMYQNATARDEIPRLGQEPFSRLMFGTNAEIDFEPLWMTKAVNLLPLVKTDAPSTARFTFELAGSIVQPTSGDEAYVDDFEGSQQEFALGENHEGWDEASPPYDEDVLSATPESRDEEDLKYLRAPAWHWYWYQPAHYRGEATPWDSIWTHRKGETASQAEDYASTLRLVVYPFPEDSSLHPGIIDSTGRPRINPWAGIVKSIPLGLKDHEDDKYFEFWVDDHGAGGTLNIDIGEVAEDLSLDGRLPNGQPDTERKNHNETLYIPERDRGLDSLLDPAEIYYYPRFTRNGWEWTELIYGDRRLGDFAVDPARDNWIKYEKTNEKTLSATERKFVNGTQNDQELSSEALSVDGFNLHRDNFYRISLDLASLKSSPYYDPPGNDASSKRWHRVRIPIKGEHWRAIGRPDWGEVRAVRVWWSDFADTLVTAARMLEFTGMKFVGNQWQAVDTTDTASIEASERNSEDDKDIYKTPPPIRQRLEERNEGGAERLERALNLKYRNLQPGELSLVERHFGEWEDVNLSAYEELRMFIRGFSTRTLTKIHKSTGDTIGDSTDFMPIDSRTWLVLRFGNDDSTYYEYRVRNIIARTDGQVEARHLWQEVAIDLKELSALKLNYLERYTDTVSSIDTLRQKGPNATYRVHSRTRVMPTFSDIKWVALGVMRDGAAVVPDSGEIWIEGLRVSGLESRKGMAFTGDFRTQWADFMTLDANLSYKNADFRSMSEDFLPERPTTLSGGMSATWTLNKFLPAEWGVSVPLGVQVGSELMRPKIKSGSDIYLTDKESGEPDGIKDMGKDFASMVLGRELHSDTTEAEHYETRKATRAWNISYSKSNTGKNPVTNLTVDRIDVGYRYTMDTTVVKEGERAGGGDHFRIETNRRRSGSVKYDLSPRDPPDWTAWEPFKNATSSRLPSQMKQYKLTFMPSVVQFDLLDATYSTAYDTSTIDRFGEFQEDLGMNHGFQFKYTPWSPVLNLDYTLSFNRNLKSALQKWRNRKAGDRFVNKGKVPVWDGFLGDAVFQMHPQWRDYRVTLGEDSRDQRAGVDFSPQFVDWLTHTVDYEATADQTLTRRGGGDSTSYMNVGVNTTFRFNSDFRIRALLADLSDVTQNRQGLTAAFAAMDKALGKIELSGINFSYDARSGLKNNYFDPRYLEGEGVSAWRFQRYKLGLYRRSFTDIVTGSYDDSAFGGMVSRTGDTTTLADRDTRTGSQGITVGTRMRIPDPVDVSINTITLGWRREYTRVPEKPFYRDSTLTFPEWTLGMSSGVLERFPFVKVSMDNLDLSSSYRYSKSWTKKPSGALVDTTTSISHGFAPLVGLSGRVRKIPVDLSYTCNWDKTISEASGQGTNRTETTLGNSWDATYTVRPAGTPREINLFNRWVIPIKGEFNAGLAIQQSRMNVEIRVGEQDPEKLEDKSFSLHPHMSYDFTDNVRGTTEYIYTSTEDGDTKEKYDEHIFTLTVRINF